MKVYPEHQCPVVSFPALPWAARVFALIYPCVIRATSSGQTDGSCREICRQIREIKTLSHRRRPWLWRGTGCQGLVKVQSATSEASLQIRRRL